MPVTKEPKTSTDAAGQISCTTSVTDWSASTLADCSAWLGARNAQKSTRSAHTPHNIGMIADSSACMPDERAGSLSGAHRCAAEATGW